MRLSRSASLAAALLLAAGLVGCGATDDAVNSTPRLMPATAIDEASYAFEFADGDKVRMEGTGSFRTGAASVTKIHVDELVMDGRTMRGITYLRADDRIFSRYADIARVIPPMATRWVEASAAELGPDVRFLWLLFAEAGLADPQQQRAMLDAAPSTWVGTEPVDGVPTTHWTAEPTSRDLLAADISPTLLEAMGEPTATELDGPMKLDAWVDSDGRVRRFELTGLGAEAGLLVRTTSSFDVSGIAEFGVPDPEQVVDHSDFQRLGRLGTRMGAGRASAAEVREFAALCRELRLGCPAAPAPGSAARLT